YLLGQLPELDEIRLEDEYLTDASTQAELLSVEDELVDAYARGQLSPDERQRLEQRFLSSPRGREKLQTAKSLAIVAAQLRAAQARPAPAMPAAAASAAPLSSKEPPPTRPRWRRMERWSFGLAFSAAAIAVIVGWTLWSRRSPAPQPAPSGP